MATEMLVEEDTVRDLVANSVLASPPELLVRIINSLNSDLTSRQIGEIVGQDQSVSAQILRLANSSFFGFKGKVGTLDKAINILGTKMVRNVVMSSSLISCTHRLRLWNMDIGNFWLHTLLVGEFSRELAQCANINADEAYIGGLLHDIGKLILYAQKQSKTKLFGAVHTSKDIDDYEITTWSITHLDVSQVLLRNWNLPENIIQAIATQNQPDSTNKAAIVIFLANEFANVISDPNWKSELDHETCSALLAHLRLSEADFNNCAARLPRIAEKSRNMLSALFKDNGAMPSRRTNAGATLVCPDPVPLSKSLLELLGYNVDVLHPDRVREDAAAAEQISEESKAAAEENEEAMSRTQVLRRTLKSRLFRVFRDEQVAVEPHPADDKPAEESSSPEPIRWQFLVVFDQSETVDLPVGRRAYTITRESEVSDGQLPFFFTHADLS